MQNEIYDEKNGEIYDTARMRSEELGSIGFFGAENLDTQTNVGKDCLLYTSTIPHYRRLRNEALAEDTKAVRDEMNELLAQYRREKENAETR